MKEDMLRKENAINEAKECLRSFISSRIELALERISKNPEYIELCEQQDKSQEAVDLLLEKLGEENALAIRRHYEMETMRQSFEIDEAYTQGVKDGIQFLAGLDIFKVKDWIND